MTTIQKLCGCHNGFTYCKWGEFDHNKPMDEVRYRFLSAWDRLCDLPRRLRWRLADPLAEFATWLRGHKSSNLHYSVYANEAEHISERIRWSLICGGMNDPTITLDRETVDQMFDNLERLSQLARATWWHDVKRVEEKLP